MDFLYQTGRQWIVHWQSAPAASRWTLGVILVLGGLAVAAVVGWPRSELREVLFDGVEFSRSELTAMETAFGKSQLNEARIVGRAMDVPQRDKHLYLKALHDHQALPATFFSFSQRSLASDSPFTSPRQRDALTKLAKEQELALMLRKISGIEEVSVQFEDVDLGGFPRKKQRQATAAARAADILPLERHVVRAIRATLMNTLGITDAQAVTVLDLNAGMAYTGADPQAEPPPDGADDVESRVARREHDEPQALADDPSAIPAAESLAADVDQREAPRAAARGARRNPFIQQAHALAPATGHSTELVTNDSQAEAATSAPSAPDASPLLSEGWNACWQMIPSVKRLAQWLRDNGVTFSVACGGVAVMMALARRLRLTRARVHRARSVLRTPAAVSDPNSTAHRLDARGDADEELGESADRRRQLHQQVHEDVDSAAATLRQWLSNAA